MKFLNNTRLFAIVLLAFSFTAINAFGQDDKSQRVSPPAQATAQVGEATVLIDYSRPSVKGREIYGALVPYNEVWRAGANEATTFMVDKDVTIEGQMLPAGKYALFAIPGEEEWTLIFNKTAEQWGAYEYDEAQDALRVQVEPQPAPEQTEMLTYVVDENGEVSLLWADTAVAFTVAED